MSADQERRVPERRATLTDVAKQAGVSTALVSLVMRGAPGASPANREKVFRVARELGYVPDSRARALRQGRSQLLGVMFDVQQPFHADLVEGIYVAAEEAGYDVVLSAVTRTRGEDKAVQTLLADRCEALILVVPKSNREWLDGVAQRLPTVVIARQLRHPEISVIRTVDAKGVGLAVNHLVELGHTHIVHIDGGGAPSAEHRRRGYRAAMARHGLEPRIVRGGWSESAGSQAVEKLLATQDIPTAIVAFNDQCANGILSSLQRAGLAVPQSISVVGFDDTHYASFSHIELTTVRQDVELMARLAVADAVRRLSPGSHQQADAVVAPTLVIRRTTGAVRDRATAPS